MFKTTVSENENRITVDLRGLQSMLSVGRGTAEATAEKAGAVVRIGRRKLYNVRKVEAYIDGLTEAGSEG